MSGLFISNLRTGVSGGICSDSMDGRDRNGRIGCDIASEIDKEPQMSQVLNTN